MKVDLNWLDLLLSLALPMLVALVTARVAHPAIKALTLAFLAALASVLQALVAVDGVFSSVDWSNTASQAVAIFLVGVGLHFGRLSPLKVTGSDGVIQGAVPAGLGGGRHEFIEPGPSTLR